MEKNCIICGDRIIDRCEKGDAKTCSQSCAGKLAWISREEMFKESLR